YTSHGSTANGSATTADYLHWDVDRVGEWVVEIGMERYRADFIRNDITGDILSDLDYATLKDIGIIK
ncbi:hypothetical protein HK101_006734, partial [Irineochytrium annulatum]